MNTLGSDIIDTDGVGISGQSLTVLGSRISGDNVTLAAAHDLVLQSMQETSEQHTTNKARSGGVGITIGAETGGIGLYANYNQAKGHSDGTSTSHVETLVDAGSTLTLISGSDTTLKGAQVGGETVIGRVGGNLSLISEQDTSTFDRKDKNGGFDLAVGSGGGSFSGSYGQNRIESDYSSVREQTGIQAGDGGFDIIVGGHTDLVGAALASTADPSKNYLNTGSLSVSDLKNEAEYNASGWGGSIGIGSGGIGGSPNLSIPQGEDASSITKSDIAAGMVEIRNGDESALASLDRTVTELQQEGLKEIFDEEKVRERQELGQLAGQVGYNLAGDLAAKMGWAEGSTEKTLLHGAVGAAVAALGGGDVLQGVAGAAANQLAFGAIYDYLIGQGLDPMSSEFATYVQLASLAVGGAFGGEAGAVIALSATQNNWLNHREYEEAQQAKAACSPSNQEACARYRELEELDRSRNAEFAAYYANAFQEAQIKGVVVDEAWSKNVEQTYWRENLGLFGEPYFLDGSHQAVSKTMGERLYEIFQAPGVRESGGWVNAGLLDVLGNAAAGFQNLLNPGYGKNYFTGESVTETDAIDARFFGFVDLATLFLGGTVSSAEKSVVRAVAGDARRIESSAAKGISTALTDAEAGGYSLYDEFRLPGGWDWPKNLGFVGEPVEATLPVGTRLDRYGPPSWIIFVSSRYSI